MDAPLTASRGPQHGGSQSPQKRSSNNYRNHRGRGGGRGHHRSPQRERSRSRSRGPPRFRDNNRRDDFGRDVGMKKGINQGNGYYGSHDMDVVGRENGSRDNSSSLAAAARAQNHGGSAPQQNQQSKAQDSSRQGMHLPVKHQYRINKDAKPDEKLGDVNAEDPRSDDPLKRITRKARGNGNGRNTESFDPASTLVRPDLRVWVGSKDKRVYDKPLKHDDVVIVPELFGDEDNWDLYYKLVEEIRNLQKTNPRASWQSWHEGAHLISNDPKGSPTFERVIDRLCEYFNIKKQSVGTRFNWYKDSSDWKPFHHDSAAYNPGRARTQNITVGVSFGARRELAFLRATPQENGEKVKVYFPQPNNGVFSFGRDVNILWKHGVNALAEEEQDGKGRISIILWGLALDAKEEEGSPPMLGSDGQGPHAKRGFHGKGRNNHGKNGRKGNNSNHGGQHNGQHRGKKQHNN